MEQGTDMESQVMYDIDFDDLRDQYQKGFNILMEYFDSIHDSEKPKVDKRLKKIGL